MAFLLLTFQCAFYQKKKDGFPRLQSAAHFKKKSFGRRAVLFILICAFVASDSYDKLILLILLILLVP